MGNVDLFTKNACQEYVNNFKIATELCISGKLSKDRYVNYGTRINDFLKQNKIPFGLWLQLTK